MKEKDATGNLVKYLYSRYMASHTVNVGYYYTASNTIIYLSYDSCYFANFLSCC